jgi:hypothetical protein
MAVKFPAGQTVLENWAPVVADSLIAAGVYAEIHFSGKASRAHRELQSHTDAKLAIAIKEAAEANQKAAEANERTAALQIALEEERSKRRSRTITQEQFDLLQKLRGKLENIEVRWDVRDIETSFFAGLLMTALRHAGIGLRVRPPGGNDIWSGVLVLLPSDWRDKPAMDHLLVKVLSEAGLYGGSGHIPSLQLWGDLPQDMPLLLIGRRPVELSTTFTPPPHGEAAGTTE